MKIGLIHATTTAIDPIIDAFLKVSSRIELVHFMDTTLLDNLKNYNCIHPVVLNKFIYFSKMAEKENVDCILLTCSAFNDVPDIIQHNISTKIFRSDQAILNKIIYYEKVAIIATVIETPVVLEKFIKKHNPQISIKVSINTRAFGLLKKGKKDEHNNIIINMMKEVEDQVDCIILSQYSMSGIENIYYCKVPVVSGTLLSAKQCFDYLVNSKKNNT